MNHKENGAVSLAAPFFRGYMVHAYSDIRKSRIFILGRLEDGRSFAIIETRWQPSLHINKTESENLTRILSPIKNNNNENYEILPSSLESFNGEELLELRFKNFPSRNAAAKLLEEAGIASPDSDIKIHDAFLISLGIRGPLEIMGESRPGRLVDIVFQNPGLSVPKNFSLLDVPLKLCSIDIETDVESKKILAIGFSLTQWNKNTEKQGLVRVLAPKDFGLSGALQSPPGHKEIIFHPDEKSMLIAFLKDMANADADVLTGWNFLDFDYPVLAERFSYYNIPFLLGRSDEEAKFFPGRSGAHGRVYSAAALVPGRQVIDALRVMRSGPQRLSSYTLEAAAQAVLGESKSVVSEGEKKISELKELYQKDPQSFGAYCKRDAELVPEILEKTGLFRLTLERASLTGVSLDKAWTSVVSFERIYGLQLNARKIAPPAANAERRVTGAAGGTVLDPETGIFPNVGVFDFRSLYPTIIRTFNIDPLAHARAKNTSPDIIRAPNGACFSRVPGILPALIASYFEERRKALETGDQEASHVYKILMNSFYGVMGTASCRYGISELAGAITSFAKKWLIFSRDWFNKKGFRVLYGDTDSLFVESGLGDEAPYAAFLDWGKTLSAELNRVIEETIKNEYGLESHIELRFEKPYRRFMIPPVRNTKGESRGRAKGYGGWVLDSAGSLTTEVKGMEAVRSDSTPLARRVQVEILEQVFKGGGLAELKAYIHNIVKDLRGSRLDNELVYRKRLSKPAEDYTSSTPPQVKAARALGWKNRRGTVEYVWTLCGPEPTALPHGQLDYDHYIESQILPVARSIAAAAGWDTETLLPGTNDRHTKSQMELEFTDI